MSAKQDSNLHPSVSTQVPLPLDHLHSMISSLLNSYASKSLTPAETIYANIECEMLAVVFGCLKFHHYLYGRSFVCISDHQSLENIHLNHLSDA